MSHPQSFPSKTISSLERARQDVHTLKQHMAQMLRSPHPTEQNTALQLVARVQHADSLVQKAEATFKRIKRSGAIPSRPTASVPASERAKRSLSVLLCAVGTNGEELGKKEEDNVHMKIENSLQKQQQQKEEDEKRNVKQKVGGEVQGCVDPRSIQYLSFAGKAKSCPIAENELGLILSDVAKETDLVIARLGNRGVGLECRNVFRALIWFKDVENGKRCKQDHMETNLTSSTYLIPEHVGCFGVDESQASRWSTSQYAVFNVVTERANAAVRYYMAREETGKDAFVALVKWLAKHKTLFSSKCEDRRLAFDSSRGIFLPPCVYPFDASASPRFPRASIPVRNNSSYVTQSNVRVPSSSAGQQHHSSTQKVSVAMQPNGAGANVNANIQQGGDASASAAAGVAQSAVTNSVATSSSAVARSNEAATQ